MSDAVVVMQAKLPASARPNTTLPVIQPGLLMMLEVPGIPKLAKFYIDWDMPMSLVEESGIFSCPGFDSPEDTCNMLPHACLGGMDQGWSEALPWKVEFV
jgi:hypothetical protein